MLKTSQNYLTNCNENNYQSIRKRSFKIPSLKYVALPNTGDMNTAEITKYDKDTLTNPNMAMTIITNELNFMNKKISKFCAYILYNRHDLTLMFKNIITSL